MRPSPAWPAAALALAALLGCAHAPPPPAAAARTLTLEGPPEPILPGLASTPLTEVRSTLSPDGTRLLWGVIGWTGGPGGWEILESVRTAAGWGAPRAVEFDSPANEFDPSFAPDGAGVFFFSNRPGGLGGDDLWYAPLDAATGRYGAAVNLGPGVNTPGDEWAPCVSPDGARLLFATDGRGGAGKHDLFVARRTAEGSWGEPGNLGAVNGPEEDFDAAWLGAGEALVYARGPLDGPVSLHWASLEGGAWRPRGRLGPEVNGPEGEAFTIGPSTSPAEPGWLSFSAGRAGGAGRLDLWRVRYRLGGGR